MPEPDGPSPDELLEEIRDLHRSVWASAAPPATEKEAQKLYVQNRFRQLGAELMERGVTVAMLEGTWLVWWGGWPVHSALTRAASSFVLRTSAR
jgi:hypothetical protein